MSVNKRYYSPKELETTYGFSCNKICDAIRYLKIDCKKSRSSGKRASYLITPIQMVEIVEALEWSEGLIGETLEDEDWEP